MTIERINEKLSEDKILSVRFPFKPTLLQVDDKGFYSESGNTTAYSALVWQNDVNSWGIFEFNPLVFQVLNAYATRHNGMDKLEILLSKHPDGSIRLNGGFDNLQTIENIVGEINFAAAKSASVRLVERYKKLANVKLMF